MIAKWNVDVAADVKTNGVAVFDELAELANRAFERRGEALSQHDILDAIAGDVKPATWNGAELDKCPGLRSCDMYEHFHCSGCGEVIRVERVDVDELSLPKNANICSCGRVKHRDCECGARC